MRDGSIHYSDVSVRCTDNHEGHQVDHDGPPFSPLIRRGSGGACEKALLSGRGYPFTGQLRPESLFAELPPLADTCALSFFP